MKSFSFDKPRGFALKAASEFYEGFTPGSGMAVADADDLTLAFRLDHSFEAVAVGLREEGEQIVAQLVGTDDARTARKQVARMLGLEVEGQSWLAVGERDPGVGRLQAEFRGFFTAAKPSPYDAATWGIIAARLNIKQAAKLKIGLAEQHGDEVRIKGRLHHVFPSPKQLLEVPTFTGLSDEKLARLKGIAIAALEGKLDPDRLRAMDEHAALEELQQLTGVGPWTASHILYRGAALIDGLPTAEPRVLHGLADAYRLKEVSAETMSEISEGWRPFRMWVCILLSRHLGRIGGWQKPEYAKERAKAGRALKRHTSHALKLRTVSGAPGNGPFSPAVGLDQWMT